MKFTFARYNVVESILLLIIIIVFGTAAFLPFVTYHFPHFVYDPETTLDHPGYKTSIFLFCLGYSLLLVASSFFRDKVQKVIQVLALIGIPLTVTLVIVDANTLLEDTGIEFRYGRTLTIVGVVLSLIFAFIHFVKTHKRKTKKPSGDILDQF